MARFLLLLLVLTASIFRTQSRRLKSVKLDPVIDAQVQDDVEGADERVNPEVLSEDEEDEGPEVLSEDEEDELSLPDEDVNILVPIEDFRDQMRHEIDQGRESLASFAISACESQEVEDVLLASSTFTATVFDVLDHTWHRIKYRQSKKQNYESRILDEIAILAGTTTCISYRNKIVSKTENSYIQPQADPGAGESSRLCPILRSWPSYPNRVTTDL